MTRTAHQLPRLLAAILLTMGVALGLVVVQPSAAHAAESDTIYTLVNEARWSQGFAGLVRNPAMDAVAANWATTLSQAGTLSHNPDYSTQIPGGWVAAGENVAQGYAGGTAMHTGWMNSPGHRANILGNFTDIGIAYLEAGGTTWGVQVFANYPGSIGPAAPAAAALAAPVEAAPNAQTQASAEVAQSATPAPAPSTSAPVSPASGAAGDGSAGSGSASSTDGDTKYARASATLTAGELENRRPVESTANGLGLTGSPSTLNPGAPGAAILGVIMVTAATIVSYRRRARPPRRARHAA
jgi:Cysteine-rich secretory protein family